MGDAAQSRPLLVLITGSYPWSSAAEDSFIGPELDHLLARFDIIIVPFVPIGTVAVVDPRIRVVAAMGTASRWRRMAATVSGLASRLFWRELFGQPSLCVRPGALRGLIAHLQKAHLIRDILAGVLDENGGRGALVCTYWFEAMTTAASLLMGRRRVPVVTRAHGWDLFHERRDDGYIPLRHQAIAAVDRVFSVSRAGEAYLRQRYPTAVERIGYAPMGTPEPGSCTLGDVIASRHIVTCAYCVPVKRLTLVVDVLARCAAFVPELKLSWTHIGAGPLFEQVRTYAATQLCDRVATTFTGSLANADVIAFYRDHRVDLLLSLSASEGRPVSMMEATSVGVPIVATDVGGVSELVGDDNGALVRVDADPAAIAEVVCAQLRKPLDERSRQRGASRQRWEQRADAARVFAEFADRLLAMAHAPGDGRQ